MAGSEAKSWAIGALVWAGLAAAATHPAWLVTAAGAQLTDVNHKACHQRTVCNASESGDCQSFSSDCANHDCGATCAGVAKRICVPQLNSNCVAFPTYTCGFVDRLTCKNPTQPGGTCVCEGFLSLFSCGSTVETCQ